MKWISDGVQIVRENISKGVVYVTDDFERFQEFMRVMHQNNLLIADIQTYPTLQVFKHVKTTKDGDIEVEDFEEDIDTNNVILRIKNALSKGYNIMYYYVHTQAQANVVLEYLIAVIRDYSLYKEDIGGLYVFADYNYFSQIKTIPVIEIKPTEEEYKKLIKASKIKYMKIYNATDYIDPDIKLLKGLPLFYAKSVLKQSREVKSINGKVTIYHDEKIMAKLRKEYIKRAGFDIVETDIDFSRVGGMKDIKQLFYERIKPSFENPELLEEYDIRPVKGILLYGDSGTGKSYIAKAIANELHKIMISADPNRIYGSLVGETEKNIYHLFKIANDFDAILYFDEFEAVSLDREKFSFNSAVDNRVINMLLTNIQDNNVFIIATTNYIDRIDKAMRRRFDYIIEVGYPDEKDRAEIFKVHLSKTKKVDQIDYERLAKLSEYLKPSEIEQIVTKAKVRAMNSRKNITQEMLEEEIENMKRAINIDERKSKIGRNIIVNEDVRI